MNKTINYVFILISFSVFSQNNLSFAQALNIAGKQSMLCVRLTKEKVFKITNPSNKNTEHRLNASLIQFEQNISILKKMELPSHIHSKTIEIEMLWVGYKANILDNERLSAIKAIEYNDVMLSNCKYIFDNLLSFSKNNTLYPYGSSKIEFPEAYIASNNLKYLSQKLSLYYNTYYSKVLPYNAKYFDTLISEIDSSIATIHKYKETTSEIKERIVSIKKLWDNTKSSINEVIQSNFTDNLDYPKPDYIFNQSDKLLKDSDSLIRLYKENSDIN